MAMINTTMINHSTKDSRWLTLEVCREYQRNKCTRTENECKFAHPPAHVEVQNGRVIACFDSIKGKCQRKDPPCKYLHPPQHLREQLLQNGRNNLILKSLQYQALQQQVIPGIIPMAGGKPVAYPTAVLPGPYVAPHYLSTVPTTAVPTQFSHYGLPTVAVHGGAADGTGTLVSSQVPGVISTAMPTKAPARPDRLEPPMVEVLAASKKRPREPADELVLPQLGMVPPYKRVAVDGSSLGKSGIPVYQPTLPTAAAYHQAATLMQLQQQQYIPAVTYSGEVRSADYPIYRHQVPSGYEIQYNGEVMSAAYPNYLQQVTGHPPTVPRF